MRIEKHETEIIGKLVLKEGKLVKDANCLRIYDLTENYLRKIVTDDSGWCVLFQDPHDDRYWELVYLESYMQGGGPPSLLNIGNRLDKYKIEL